MKNNSILIIIIRSYSNADTQKKLIYLDNINKSGIYRWINLVSGKFYVGYSINLTKRFRDYFSINSLIKNIKRNKSKIYRALLKYGYFNFKLEIIEYCDPTIIIEREQYYLDNLRPEYNILKYARSSYGFKHSKKIIEKIRIANIGCKHSKAYSVTVINNKTGEVKLFTSIRQAAKFIGIHYSSIIICLRKNKFYIGKGYFITRI